MCGKSGGGKTRFLAGLKERFQKKNISVGFVRQNFDAQILTDKVWSELSFALENEGLPHEKIFRRVGEVANYFGLNKWLSKDTAFLSGGEKQLLNLAAVTAVSPDVLLLDEPTSQLDPAAASNFLAAVQKLNREFGITVVIAEHRIEDIFSLSDRVIFFDKGKAVFFDTPEKTARFLRNYSNGIGMEFLPAAARLFFENETDFSSKIPLNVAQGRIWISEFLRAGKNFRVTDGRHAAGDERDFTLIEAQAECRTAGPERSEGNARKIIQVRNVSFCYEKKVPILKDLTFDIFEGEIFAVAGANGSGKSTFLKILQGIERASGGKIKIFGKKMRMLPQNVRDLFVHESARLELEECGWNGGELAFFDGDLNAHPFDLSGGEMEKLALEKIFVQKPEIILLDEPTKGLDNAFKKELAAALRKIASGGVTFVLVCHDLEFCAMCADRVSLLFDGTLSGTSCAAEFFAGNNFYTTAMNRMFRGIAGADGDVRT